MKSTLQVFYFTAWSKKDKKKNEGQRHKPQKVKFVSLSLRQPILETTGIWDKKRCISWWQSFFLFFPSLTLLICCKSVSCLLDFFHGKTYHQVRKEDGDQERSSSRSVSSSQHLLFLSTCCCVLCLMFSLILVLVELYSKAFGWYCISLSKEIHTIHNHIQVESQVKASVSTFLVLRCQATPSLSLKSMTWSFQRHGSSPWVGQCECHF